MSWRYVPRCRVIPSTPETNDTHCQAASYRWQAAEIDCSANIDSDAYQALKPQRRSRRNYRVFGGGFGFGTPVVSYAPRPIFIIDAVSLKVIKASWCLWVVMMLAVVLMKRSHWGCERILYIRKAAAMLTVTHQNRFWAVYAPASYS